MYDWARDLFLIRRSLTVEGVCETLAYFGALPPGLEVHEVSSGSQVHDWTVPYEWNIRDAYVLDDAGNKIIDFNANNLHATSNSEPVDVCLDLEDLGAHLYSIPAKPQAIP